MTWIDLSITIKIKTNKERVTHHFFSSFPRDHRGRALRRSQPDLASALHFGSEPNTPRGRRAVSQQRFLDLLRDTSAEDDSGNGSSGDERRKFR